MDLSPKNLRRHVIHMAFKGQTVHIPCAFSIIEVLSVLYSRHIKFDPGSCDSPDRDYFVLSKGHGVMALYAIFREIGWLEQRDLDTYFSDGSALHGLSECGVPGLEVTSGSLGHGLPIATGIALGLKLKGRSSQHVYCLVGDGEMNEGPMWEAMLFAAHHQLSNLTVIVDANQFQAMGRTDEVLGLEPFAEKFRSFGFETRECDGHDEEAIDQALASFGSSAESKPRALIARTLKGTGVSFMAGDNRWHYTRLTDEAYRRAMEELR